MKWMPVALLAAGCSGGGLKVKPGTVLFDNFVYQGEDTYYKENPLPDESSYYNAIIPGWYSDPSVCTNGKGDYYLVTSTFGYFPGVPIFHSRDLLNWKQIGNVLTRESQLPLIGQSVGTGGIYAPAISYNPANETYYMITTNIGGLVDRSGKIPGNFVVKTKDPAGEWSDPIPLPEVRGIDPSLMFDDDGKAYVVNCGMPEGMKQEYPGHMAIHLYEYDVVNDKILSDEIVVDKGTHPENQPKSIEGPHLYTINGMYYLMAAEGGTEPSHSEVIFRSDSPKGPYTAWDKNPMLTQRTLDPKRPNPVTCTGHADIFQDTKGNWWGVFLGCRPIEGTYENLGRETFLMPVKWSDDGYPYFTQGEDLVPLIGRVEGAKRDAEVTFGNFEVSEDFSSTQLAPYWLTARGPATDLYSLTSVPGMLELKCAPESSSSTHVISYVGRRMQHHLFTVTAEMEFAPQNDQEKAGLLLLKSESRQYFFGLGKENGILNAFVQQVGDGQMDVLASMPLPDGTGKVHLKVVSKGSTYEFYYATHKDNWQLVKEGVDARYLATSYETGISSSFTGTTIGMFATSNQVPVKKVDPLRQLQEKKE